MKILLVSPFSANKVGGIGTWTKAVLDYADINCKEIIRFQNTACELKQSITNQFVRIIISSLDSVRILMILMVNMIKYKPDIVHYTSSARSALYKDIIAAFIVEKVFGKKFIIHWHFGRIPEISQNRTREYKLLKRVHLLSSASIVLDYKSESVMKEDGLFNVFMVPNAIPQVAHDYGRTLNIDIIQNNREPFTILFVGHLLRAKGVFELVEACTELDNTKLILIGPDLEGIKEELYRIAKLRDGGEWLKFMGELNRDKVFSYYSKCGIFCLPSYTEGFPYVILESMACGCSIVSTSVGAIPDMLSDDSGIIISPRDKIVLKDAITALINNKKLANQIGINAYNRVYKTYSLQRVFNSLTCIWNNIYGINR